MIRVPPFASQVVVTTTPGWILALIYRGADSFLQRQTVVSQFFQLDRLVVEGGKTV